MRLPKPNNIITEKYVVGMSVFKNRLAKIKLSANESALGPSPKAKKEYIKVSKSFARYPDTNGTFLRETLSKKFKLDKNRIILGSGSDQIFELICKAYLYSSALKLFSNFKNVVMTRTFSKIYGLAGLRVGWGYGSKEIIDTLNKIKPPFNVNKAALFAASAAIKDSAWLNKEIKHVNNWNKKMFNEFKKMKIETNKSYSNFLLVNFDKVKINSSRVFKLLAKAGILVRKMDVYGIKNSLRITIGKSEENRKLISKMKRILNV